MTRRFTENFIAGASIVFSNSGVGQLIATATSSDGLLEMME